MKVTLILKIFSIMVIVFLSYLLYNAVTNPSIYKINIIKKESHNLIDDFSNSFQSDYWSIIDRASDSNSELNYYSPNNVILNNNAIEIVAKKENYNGLSYTSGFITTRDKYSFLYGKVIFRAKTAAGKGLLSAVWMLPEDGTRLPEVDIIEALGDAPQKIWTSMHYLTDNGIEKYFNCYDIGNNDYALYELDWKENELDWYINDKLVYKITDNVPNKRMYLNINLAVGGDWPGTPLDNIFPSNFNIDYILVIPQEAS